MSDPKEKNIVCSLETLAQVAMTGYREGWQDRDKFCSDRHCAKCHRKDGHGGMAAPKNTKEKAGQRVARELMKEMERQRASRAYLGGGGGLILPPGMGYDEPEPN